jgi:hypothetical protein
MTASPSTPVDTPDAAPGHGPGDHSTRTAYGLTRPTVADAVASLTVALRSGEHARAVVETLLRQLRSTTDSLPKVATRLTIAMTRSDDPVVVLCGRSLLIRQVAYDRLRAAHRAGCGITPASGRLARRPAGRTWFRTP